MQKSSLCLTILIKVHLCIPKCTKKIIMANHFNTVHFIQGFNLIELEMTCNSFISVKGTFLVILVFIQMEKKQGSVTLISPCMSLLILK